MATCPELLPDGAPVGSRTRDLSITSQTRYPREHKFGENGGGLGKSGVLEHKSGNISETRKDRGKVTMEGL